MINLIPPQGHTVIRNEYILRVGAVYAFLLSVVLAALVTLFIPSNMLTEVQLNSLTATSDVQKNVGSEYVDADKTVRAANVLIAQLGQPTNNVFISAIIEEIVNTGGKNITFKTLQTSTSEDRVVINVQGTAATRAALTSFKSALEAKENIASADVPISDLAKDSDLPFVIKVTLKNQ